MTKIKEKVDARKLKLQKTWYGKVFYFIWYEDSMLSWIANIILAFVFIKFLFYPLLGLIFSTELPVVAVISCSMEHKYTNCGEKIYSDNLCGISGQGKANFDTFWQTCGDFYELRGISKKDFAEFPLSNGFNKGDIIFLKGTDIKDIEVGEIIVFDAEKRAYPIIHRVIENKGVVIETKGDHNKAQINDGFLDETNVLEKQIRGKTILRIPYLGYIKIWFTDLVNFLR